MGHVTIKFNNKEFILTCEDEQEERKQIEFYEKIDELNQETDTI